MIFICVNKFAFKYFDSWFFFGSGVSWVGRKIGGAVGRCSLSNNTSNFKQQLFIWYPFDSNNFIILYIPCFFYMLVFIVVEWDGLVGGLWIKYKDDIQHQHSRQFNISQLQLFNLHLGEPIIFRGAHRTHKLWKIIVIPFTIASLYKAVSWHIF